MPQHFPTSGRINSMGSHNTSLTEKLIKSKGLHKLNQSNASMQLKHNQRVIKNQKLSGRPNFSFYPSISILLRNLTFNWSIDFILPNLINNVSGLAKNMLSSNIKSIVL